MYNFVFCSISMKKFNLLLAISIILLNTICIAQQKEAKVYRLGVMSGLGANGTISVNKKTLEDYTYSTSIGGGWALQNLYLIIDTRNTEQQRLSAKIGYFASTASVPVSLTNANFVINSKYAREVDCMYKFHFIHVPVDYHAKVYVGNDSRRKTSLVGGPDIAFAVKASSVCKVKPMGSSMFTTYKTSSLSANNYSQFQFGGHIGWHYEQEIKENRSWVAGYNITAFLNDLSKEQLDTQMPILYKDGYNTMFTNLFYIGLMF
jgi:hypothetical protein